MELTVTETHTIDSTNLCDTPETVGQWMLECALSEWYNYDDEGSFDHEWLADGSCRIIDRDEKGDITVTPLEFFEAHARLIWLAQITNYRHDWIEFAFKSRGANPDEYDANTCDAVLQNMLYGKVVYG